MTTLIRPRTVGTMTTRLKERRLLYLCKQSNINVWGRGRGLANYIWQARYEAGTGTYVYMWSINFYLYKDILLFRYQCQPALGFMGLSDLLLQTSTGIYIKIFKYSRSTIFTPVHPGAL